MPSSWRNELQTGYSQAFDDEPLGGIKVRNKFESKRKNQEFLGSRCPLTRQTLTLPGAQG